MDPRKRVVTLCPHGRAVFAARDDVDLLELEKRGEKLFPIIDLIRSVPLHKQGQGGLYSHQVLKHKRFAGGLCRSRETWPVNRRSFRFTLSAMMCVYQARARPGVTFGRRDSHMTSS